MKHGLLSIGFVVFLVATSVPACDAATPPVTPTPAAPPITVECRGKPTVGKPASTFDMPSINAGRATVAAKRVTVVDFWATWCEPCEKAFPRLQEIYDRHKQEGLEIVAISVDDREDNIGSFTKRYAVTFPVAWDVEKKVYGCYAPPNVPATYVIDREGVVRFVQTRYNDGDERELENQIKKYL